MGKPAKRFTDLASAQQKDDALFAAAAYQKNKMRRDLPNGWTYQAADSDERTGVWTRGKEVRVGLRGTDSVEDAVKTWGSIARGSQGQNEIFKKDLADYDRIKSKYGDNIRVSGHSLGGSRTEHLTRNRDVTGATFDLGASVGVSAPNYSQLTDRLRCMNPFNPPAFCKRVEHHRMGGDFVSLSSHVTGYGKKNTYWAGNNYNWMNGLNAHDMGHFSETGTWG